jgi:hypothetical protein
MNDGKSNRLKIDFHWLRGLKMDVPSNNFVLRCIGIAMLMYSASPLIQAIVQLIHELKR